MKSAPLNNKTYGLATVESNYKVWSAGYVIFSWLEQSTGVIDGAVTYKVKGCVKMTL